MAYQSSGNAAALKIGVEWDLESDINEALAGITPINKGVPQLNYPVKEVDEIHNTKQTDIDRTNISPSDFSLDFNYNYDGMENKLKAMFMGTSAAPQPVFVVVAGTNDDLDFDDTATTSMTCAIAAGTYTGTALAVLVAAGMNNCSEVAGTYTCAFSTTTLKFTIAESGGPSNFELSWQSGSNTLTNIGTLLGFSIVADDTGAATYLGDSACTGSGAYTHTMTMADSTSGIFATYGVEKGTLIHVVPSLKPQKITETVNDGYIKLSVGVRGTKVVDDSTVVTAMTSVTYAGIHNSTRAKYGQMVFWMNAQAGAALQSSDEVVVTNYTLEMDRKLDSVHGSGSYTIMEPLETGKPTIKLTLELARMNAVNELYFADWIAGTEKKILMTLTGPVIVGTSTYSVVRQFPRLIIESVEYADAGYIPCKIVFRAVVADSAPTGMTGITDPITETLVNIRSTTLIA